VKDNKLTGGRGKKRTDNRGKKKRGGVGFEFVKKDGFVNRTGGDDGFIANKNELLKKEDRGESRSFVCKKKTSENKHHQ